MNTKIKKESRFKHALHKFGKKSLSEKITYIVFFFFFLFMALLFLFPIYQSIISSFKTDEFYMDSETFAFPDEWIFYGWINIFTEFVDPVTKANYFIMLFNSLWMLVARVVLATMSSALLAYAVARFRFPGKGLLYGLVIFKQTIPIFGAGGAGFKLFVALGMYDNPLLYWIAWCSGFDFEFIVLYGAFKGISPTYSESAKIDGANNLTVFFRIIMPQALPCLLALAITQSMAAWNDFNTSLIYLPSCPTVAYGLYVFGIHGTKYSEYSKAIHNAGILVSMIPLVILYACSQKLILSNMAVGGLKG